MPRTGVTTFSPRTWREDLLQKLLWAFVVLGWPAATLAVLNSHGPTRTVFAVVMYPALLGVVVMAARRKWPFVVRAGWMIGTLMAAATAAYPLSGFYGNAAIVGATAVVVTGLLFGRRIMLLVVLYLVLVAVGTAVGMLSGVLPLPSSENVSLSAPLPWVRTTFVAGFVWLLLGLAVTYVVTTVEGAVQTEHAARLLLQEEQALRGVAETKRLEAERTALQAQKLELVGQLAAGVAHDFNNVLAVVRGWSDLGFEPDASAASQDEARAAIDSATRQGVRLAQQLLTLSRRQMRAPRRLVLAQVVDQGVHALRRVLPEDMEMSVEHAAAATIVADDSELQQILFNLVINARDAMQTGGNIRVMTGERSIAEPVDAVAGPLLPGRYSFIEVSDSGPGIEPEVRERIFEPFFTTKPAGTGTGLGLATVLSIVRGNEGGLTLVSEPGHGARFTVYLPVADGAESFAEERPSYGHVLRGSRARVLLLEDNPPVRRLMEALLERDGHEVTAVPDGRRALDELSRRGAEFDLLCSDAVVPGSPVPEVISAFERCCPDAPVLLVSGYVQEELTRRGIEEGRYQLLNKPFSSRDFRTMIASLLGSPA
ncbi:MAG TPA: ATP-binding protein [Polyangiaceae bacterium]|nr:ATP-binding protein [Polyangiaceae bacterium]